MSQTRRLAAILAADVAGYSRLMGADEEGTLERLKSLRREVVDLKITEHHGRIVETTGDGMLVEFPSVVDAVRCAVAVQQAIAERNIGVGADHRIALRVGINRRRDRRGRRLYGDRVYIAARVEALAAPPDPRPGLKEVFMRVRASSLNYRDLMGGGRGPTKIGVVPLSDDAGEVVAIGEGVTRVKIGDRIAGCFHPRWFGGPINPDYLTDRLGANLDGKLAEYAVFNEEAVVTLPSHLELILAITTKTGLTVRCELDTGQHPSGIVVSDAEIAAIEIKRAEFHGEWNYTISLNIHPP